MNYSRYQSSYWALKCPGTHEDFLEIVEAYKALTGTTEDKPIVYCRFQEEQDADGELYLHGLVQLKRRATLKQMKEIDGKYVMCC